MFVYLAPFYGMRGVPNQVKIGLSFFVSIMLFHVTQPHEALVYNTVWGYAMIVAKEALTGLFLGYGVSICTSIVAFAFWPGTTDGCVARDEAWLGETAGVDRDASGVERTVPLYRFEVF